MNAANFSIAPCAGESRANPRPLVFLDIDDVLVRGAQRRHELRFIPLLYALNVAVGTEAMEPIWDKLVAADARSHLGQLHEEFMPRYVICGRIAHAMKRVHLIDFLRRVGMSCIADNMHHAWRTEGCAHGPVFADVTSWMLSHMAETQPFVVLGNAKRRAGMGLALGDRRVIVCDAERGFDVGLLARARSSLLAQQASHAGHQPHRDNHGK